jgi:hypothetical protein
MSDPLKYHKLNEARQDLELAIRKFKAACEDIGNNVQDELIVSVFNATDRDICFEEVV